MHSLTTLISIIKNVVQNLSSGFLGSNKTIFYSFLSKKTLNKHFWNLNKLIFQLKTTLNQIKRIKINHKKISLQSWFTFMRNSEAKRHLNSTFLVKRNTLTLNLVFLFTESGHPTFFLPFIIFQWLSLFSLKLMDWNINKKKKKILLQCKSFILLGPKLKKKRFWRKEF
jgi:hypothetical protein